MGIDFDRILEGFDGPFTEIKGLFEPEPGHIHGTGGAGYLLSHQVNDAFIALNRLLASGERVFWLQEPFTLEGSRFPAGTFFVPTGSGTAAVISRLARDLGLDFTAAATRPNASSLRLRPVRIGIWDRYGGSMSSGWMRWLLEQYEFDFQVVYPPELDAGDLNKKFDALIFVSGGIPAAQSSGSSAMSRYRTSTPRDVPDEFRHMAGRVTAETTVPQLEAFLEQGGTVLTIGSSTNLAYHLNLPITSALVKKDEEDGKEKTLRMTEYFVPGSVLRVRLDNTQPLAHGMPSELDVYFNRSPVFKLSDPGGGSAVKRIAWFDSEEPLRSGWANGQSYLKDGLAVLEASVGKGTLFLFGPEITFRALPQGNFKFLFNGIYYGAAQTD
jgi:hypothetical protein